MTYLDTLVLRAHKPARDVEPIVPSIFAPVDAKPIESLGAPLDQGDLAERALSPPIERPSRQPRVAGADGDVGQIKVETYDAVDRPGSRLVSQDALIEGGPAGEPADRLVVPRPRETVSVRDGVAVNPRSHAAAGPGAHVEAADDIVTPALEQKPGTLEVVRATERPLRRLKRYIEGERRVRTVDTARVGPQSPSRDRRRIEAVPTEPADDLPSRPLLSVAGELSAIMHEPARAKDPLAVRPQTPATIAPRSAAPASPRQCVAPRDHRGTVAPAESAEAPAHTVHVTISRLEVRVTPPASGVRTERTRPSSTSLDEYVRSRKRCAR